MEAILKRLLDAELKAQQLVDHANAERERILHQALADAQAAEERFSARIPTIHSSFIAQAEERATQTIGELNRRYEERRTQLQQMAEGRREDAMEAAMALVLDPQRT